MSAPQRIQRKRTKGYRLPPDAVYVGRPSRWGNPYRPVREATGMWVPYDDNGVDYPGYGPSRTRERAMADCVRLFIEVEYECGLLADRVDVTELAGHDLVCWCPLEDERGRRVPCHADVLLELANAGDE